MDVGVIAIPKNEKSFSELKKKMQSCCNQQATITSII